MTTRFDEFLAAAASSGLTFQPQAKSSNSGPSELIVQLQRYNLAARQASELQTHCQKLQAHASGAAVLDPVAQAGRCGLMSTASTNNHLIVEHQQTLEARVRLQNSRQSVPVEADCQADFAQLLFQAAASAGKLTQGASDLHWSSQFPDTTGSWETRMQPVLEVQHVYTGIMHALETVSSALSAQSS